MFLLSQVEPGLDYAYFICQGAALFSRLEMCHVHVVKDDSVSQLTVFDLRNISDKYLVEIEACKPLDLMNHHSLDKKVALKSIIPGIVLNQSSDARFCGYQTSQFVSLFKEVKAN